MNILFISIFGEKQDDNLCPPIRSILCVKDVLFDIVNATQKINIIALTIEQNILENEPNKDKLYEYIDDQMENLRSNLPTSEYHNQYVNVNNNINQTGFIHLIKEENYAFSYLYNSIEIILKIENIFANSINKSFKKILNDLRKNILCNYRNILNVYSEEWLSINVIDGIQMSKTRKRHAPSFLYHSYSMIIIQLLDQWMKNVNNLVNNIDTKLI